MKKLKFLPSVLMLAMCIAVLCVGIYAASPTSNTVKGSITVTSMAKIKITGYVNDEELFATRNTATGVEWDLTKSDALKFNASDVETAYAVPQKIIRIRIENLSNTALGAYFFNGDENTLKTEGDGTKLATYDSLVHEAGIWPTDMAENEQTSDNKLANVIFSTYTYLAANDKAEGGYDEIDMYITIDVVNLFYEDLEGEFEYNLRVEEYRPNVTTTTYADPADGNKLVKLGDAAITDGAVPVITSTTAKAVVIPTSATKINGGKSAILCSAMEHLVIPKSVTTISEGALYGSNSLKSLSTAVQGIGYSEDGWGMFYTVAGFYAHGECGVRYDEDDIDQEYPIVVYPDAPAGTKMRSFSEYGDGGDGTYAFIIPDSFKTVYYTGTSIDAGMFRLINIETLIIGPNVTNINFNSDNAYAQTSCLGTIRKLYIPHGVTTMDGCSFVGSSLYCLSIPATLVTINLKNYDGMQYECGIFDGCDNLASLHIDKNHPTLSANNGCIIKGSTLIGFLASFSQMPNDGSIKYIDSVIFKGKTIDTLYIPASVEHIYSSDSENDCWAYFPNAKINSFKVDENNKTYVFRNNCLIHVSTGSLLKALPGAIIPTDGSVTTIGTGAFIGHSITTLIIPNSITKICAHAFSGVAISKVYIPASVTSIEYNAFDRYKAESNIYCESSSKPSGWDSNWAPIANYDDEGYIVNWGVALEDFPA